MELSGSVPFLTQEQQQLLEQLLNTLSRDQKVFLSGYLAGISGQASAEATAVNTTVAAIPSQAAPVGKPSKPVTILFGTQTGRSEEIARQLEEKALAVDLPVNVIGMDEYNPKKLKDESHVLIVVSTHGDGEPPFQAYELWEYLKGKRATKVDHLQHSVLGLGDKAYPNFCQTGVDFDAALTKLGSTPLVPVVKCDVDYEEMAAKWMDDIIEKLSGATAPQTEAPKAEIPVAAPNFLNITSAKIAYDRKNPFSAEVFEKTLLSGAGSEKEVYHVELNLEGSGLSYDPGDALGIYSQNPPELVKNILEQTGFSGDTIVKIGKEEFDLYSALLHHLEITLLTPDVVKGYARLIGSDEAKALLDSPKKQEEYLYGHDVLDLMHDLPGTLTEQQLIGVLRKMPPRMYSIASSQSAVDNEVHITVSAVRYENKGREREGSCSTYLADRIEVGKKVPVFISKNLGFKLPTNDAPMIMIGAGTGVAPYRSFIQERGEKGVKGNTWLFFGDQRFYTDFLYQIEWQKFMKDGILEKMDVAFSRDQEKKVYVQNKLKENSKEVYKWLEKEAIIYICGDKNKMAKDVHNTLVEIISNEGGMTKEKAENYLNRLQREKRYQKDVY